MAPPRPPRPSMRSFGGRLAVSRHYFKRRRKPCTGKASDAPPPHVLPSATRERPPPHMLPSAARERPPPHVLPSEARQRLPLPGVVLELFMSRSGEVRERFEEYISSENPVISVLVPGDSRIYRKSSNIARLSTAALAQWFVELHSQGYSLSGKFTAANFKITHLGFLKGDRKLLKNLKKRTEDREKKDMFCFATIIQADIYHGLVPPVDTKHPLNVLLRWRLMH